MLHGSPNRGGYIEKYSLRWVTDIGTTPWYYGAGSESLNIFPNCLGWRNNQRLSFGGEYGYPIQNMITKTHVVMIWVNGQIGTVDGNLSGVISKRFWLSPTIEVIMVSSTDLLPLTGMMYLCCHLGYEKMVIGGSGILKEKKVIQLLM